MTISMEITREHWELLQRHLFELDPEREHAAFGFANAYVSAGTQRWRITELRLVAPHELDFHSAYHLELSQETWSSVIKQAHTLKTSLVEIHSHTGQWPAAFSQSDLAGLAETVPHVHWRLKQRPFAAMVLTRRDFDALIWPTTPTHAAPLTALSVGGSEKRPTNRTLGGWDERNQRTI